MDFIEILNLLSECDLSGDLDEENFEDKILPHIPQDFSYEYFSGATKVVIVPRDYDFVIKIPFTGDEEGRYGYADLYSEIKEDLSWDYCATELKLYEKASEKHLEHNFAKIQLIGDLDGHPIYIQEKCLILSECLCEEEEIQQSINSTREHCKECDLPFFNEYWQASLMNTVGEKEFDRFMTFIRDQNISDLHMDNIGFLDERPVLIDYAGYNE